jgi:hypothetical protein
MAISKTEIKKFAKLLTEEFLEDKDTADLQGTTQDHIDAFIVPLMTEVEDLANGFISDKIKVAFEQEPLGEDDEWWTSRREKVVRREARHD